MLPIKVFNCLLCPDVSTVDPSSCSPVSEDGLNEPRACWVFGELPSGVKRGCQRGWQRTRQPYRHTTPWEAKGHWRRARFAGKVTEVETFRKRSALIPP